MKSIFLLFIFSYNSSANWIEHCKKHKEYIQMKFEELEDHSENRDVSKELDSFSKTVKWACPSKKFSKTIDKLFGEIRLEGQKNHLELVMSEASRVSEYRSPQWEYDELERVSKDMKIDNPMSFEMFSVLSRKGKRNSLKKKKSCTSIDNRKPPLVKIVNGKKVDLIRDQDSIGWCYAFAAADLISHKIGKKVSATDIANSYNDGSFDEFLGDKETEMTGGFTSIAANGILEKGICLEKDLPSDDYRFSKDSSLIKGYQSVEKLYEDYSERTSSESFWGRTSFSGSKLELAQEQFGNDLLCSRLEHEASAVFPSVSTFELYKIIKMANSSNDLIDRLVKKSCEPRLKPNTKLSFEGDDVFTSKNSMMNSINQKLESGDILGVSYQSDSLKNFLDRPSDSNHASLIVARKYNEETGSCDYMIRNSWGKTSGSSYDPRSNSKNGNHWVPEEYLVQTMYGITYAD